MTRSILWLLLVWNACAMACDVVLENTERPLQVSVPGQVTLRFSLTPSASAESLNEVWINVSNATESDSGVTLLVTFASVSEPNSGVVEYVFEAFDTFPTGNFTIYVESAANLERTGLCWNYYQIELLPRSGTSLAPTADTSLAPTAAPQTCDVVLENTERPVQVLVPGQVTLRFSLSSSAGSESLNEVWINVSNATVSESGLTLLSTFASVSNPTNGVVEYVFEALETFPTGAFTIYVESAANQERSELCWNYYEIELLPNPDASLSPTNAPSSEPSSLAADSEAPTSSTSGLPNQLLETTLCFGVSFLSMLLSD